MRSVPLVGAVAWLAFAGASFAQTAYTAVVSRDEAEVRAGPNENPQLYVTNRLRRGTPVQVVEELGNGWLKIKPPAGSFSWINTRFVEQVAPNQPNWMVIGHPDVRVPVVVGTDTKKDVPSQIEGSRLSRGAQVTGLGPARVDDEGAWLPIEPPPGEFRYLRGDAVTRSDGTAPPGPPVAAAKVTPVANASGSSGAAITEAEALGMRAAQAERDGNTTLAIDLYTRAAAAAQGSSPELARQASNRAYWLRQGVNATLHSTFTPSPLPPGDVRLTASPSVQLAGPVSVYSTTPRPGDLGAPQSPPLVSSGPGRLRRAGRCVDGCTTYVLDSLQGGLLFYVTPEQGVELEPYLNRNVELIGAAVYSGELRANYMRAQRVQALP